MPQPTDVFCHTILFAKFNVLTSFSPHFLANIEKARTIPHDFPVEQGHSVSPRNVWRGLFLKTFHGRWGTDFWGLFYMGD